MARWRFNVPFHVLLRQLDDLIAALESPRAQGLQAHVRGAGVDPAGWVTQAHLLRERGVDAEVRREQLTARLRAAYAADRRAAKRGYDWVKALQLRVRAARRREPDLSDAGALFRLGKLRRKDPPVVLRELRILLPETRRLQGELDRFGVTAAFLAEGEGVLEALDASRDATRAVEARLREATGLARGAEEDVREHVRLLADARVVAERASGEELRELDLAVLRTEVARRTAQARSRRQRAEGSGDAGAGSTGATTESDAAPAPSEDAPEGEGGPDA